MAFCLYVCTWYNMFVHSSPTTLKMSKCQFLQQFYLLQNTKTPIPYILWNFAYGHISKHHHTPLKKKNTHTSVFSKDFTQKSIFTHDFTRSLGPLRRERLVIPDPSLSARRATGTRFYAPPRAAHGSVSRRCTKRRVSFRYLEVQDT